MSQLYLVRHGPTHVKTLIGWTDVAADLSDTAALARLGKALPEDAVVVSSDLARAASTADAIQGSRVRLPHDPRLREIHMGDWEGRSWQDVDAEYGDWLRRYYEQPGDIAPPAGESWNTLSARVWEALEALLSQHQCVVAVAHMGPILCMVQRAQGISAYDALGHAIAPLSITQINFSPTGAYVPVISHLP